MLRGGKGNDRHVLNDSHGPDGPSVKQYDAVIENPGGGTDTVLVNALNVDPFSPFDAYALPAYVENAVVTGTLAFGLYGNELNNVLTGNAAANGSGGLAGNDRLNGGAGADSLFGHAGDDTYILVDLFSPSAGVFSYDAVSEAAGEGIDTVRVVSLDVNPSGADGYTLGTSIKRGIVDGSAAFNLTGNELANTLTGNAAADALLGVGGDDILIGRGGADGLNGRRRCGPVPVPGSGGLDRGGARPHRRIQPRPARPDRPRGYRRQRQRRRRPSLHVPQRGVLRRSHRASSSPSPAAPTPSSWATSTETNSPTWRSASSASKASIRAT